MAPVDGDVKWRCVIVCAILSVLLFEKTVCVHTFDRKDLLHILQTVNCEYRPKLLYFSDVLSRDNTHTQTKGRTFQHDSTHKRSRKRGRRAGVDTISTWQSPPSSPCHCAYKRTIVKEQNRRTLPTDVF